MSGFETSATRRDVLAGTAGGLVAALAAGTTPVAARSGPDDPAPIPDDPYLVPAHGAPLFRGRPNYGWDDLDVTDRVRLVRGLHPDLADFRRLIWIENMDDGLPPGASQQATFATREHLPSTSGQTIYVRADPVEAEEHWGWLRRAYDWTYPDGTPLEDPTGLFAERLDGSQQGYGVQSTGIGIPSIFAPGTLDMVFMGAKKAFSVGFSGMFLDSTTTPRIQGVDVSPWARAAFREHLASLDDARLAELDVDDPGSFDVRAAFRERGITPEDTENPSTAPLYREFLLFQHRGLQAFLAAYRERIRAEFPDRDPASTMLYGNHFLGDGLRGQPAAAIHISEVLDFVNIEDNRTLPPDVVREPVYKLMHAAAKGEKPVLVEGQMHDQPGPGETLRGLDPTRRYHTLQRLQLAEAFAAGVPRKLPLTSWGNIHADDTVTHWVEADGTIPDDLQSFADFLWVNERLLRPAEPDPDVAVVWSLPTLLWETAPQWDREASRHLDAFRGVCALLRDAQIPYDVRIFGHDALYDDAPHLDALADYDAVVLPGLSSIAARQVDALRSADDAGARIVTTAAVPDRDEDYEPRSAGWLASEAVTALDDPGIRHVRDDATPTSLADALDDVGSVTLADAPSVGVNRLRTEAPMTAQVHLVNYDYDAAADEAATKTDLAVTVTDLGFDPAVARYVTPTGNVDLSMERTADGVRVTVPSLDEWGFVVFAPDADALVPPGDEATATDRVETLATRIERAEAKLPVPEASVGLARARVYLEEARVAVDADAYEKATDRAMAGLDALATLSISVTTTTETTTSTTTTSAPGNSTSGTASTPETTAAEASGFGVAAGFLGLLGAEFVRRVGRDDET